MARSFSHNTARHATYSSGTEVDGIAVADEGTLTTDVISLIDKYAVEVSVVTEEDNTGACDGNVNVYILSSDNDPDSEGWQDKDDPGVQSFVVDQAQNATERLVFTLCASQYTQFKLHVYNQAGQEVAVTINYVTLFGM